MKHPIAAAFLIAACISLALVAIAFPFIWFFAWLVTNGMSWWKDVTADEAGDGGTRRDR